MSESIANPQIATLLRVTFFVVALVLFVGAGLFFAPEWIVSRWPWPLKPFNTRFLGAIYISEMVMVVSILVVPRWNPARLAVPLAFTFTAVVTFASLLSVEQFVGNPWLTRAWFVIYLFPMCVTAYYFWQDRARSPALSLSFTRAWRTFMAIHGAVLGLYGLGLFIAPGTFSAFWPWGLDAFHAQVYSGMFFTGAVGSYLLRRAASSIELVAFGLTELVFGSLAIVGLITVDRLANKVVWTSFETWVWLGALLAMCLSGIAMLWQARARVSSSGK